jgi:hypothetical protein
MARRDVGEPPIAVRSGIEARTWQQLPPRVRTGVGVYGPQAQVGQFREAPTQQCTQVPRRHAPKHLHPHRLLRRKPDLQPHGGDGGHDAALGSRTNRRRSAHTHTHTYTQHTHIHKQIHTHTHTYTQKIPTHSHTYTHKIPTHSHTCTHTHTHTKYPHRGHTQSKKTVH